MKASAEKFLVIYSGVLTLVFVVTVLCGFTAVTGTQRLKELDVERINIVEPDGTLRMTISDKDQFPGIIVKGKEFADPGRKAAGMLFFNDEGTENGGLIFGGAKDKDGKLSSYGHLSFDQYTQDQTVVLEGDQEGDSYSKHLSINDQPSYPITDELPLLEKYFSDPDKLNEAALQKFLADRGSGTQRLYLGEDRQHGLDLYMKDDKGRNRIVLRVQPDGSPVLQFLDVDGKIIGQMPQPGTGH